MITITKEWLESNKTKLGGYNRIQIESLGLDWPPPKGWKKLVIGSRIDSAARRAFESKTKDKSKCKHCGK